MNQLTGAEVLAEDRLFATLDPTTRRVQVISARLNLAALSCSCVPVGRAMLLVGGGGAVLAAIEV